MEKATTVTDAYEYREVREAIEAARGAEIASIDFVEEERNASWNPDTHRLVLGLKDGRELHVWDDLLLCCEDRYMTCDDDVSHYIGAQLLSVEVREVSREDSVGDCHDQAFLIVTTSKGAFTVCTHNQHNGYYGGFSLSAELKQRSPLVAARTQETQ